jgi:hypothetical protein
MQDGRDMSSVGPTDGIVALPPGWYFARRGGGQDRGLEVVSIEATPDGAVRIAVTGETRRLAPSEFAWLTPVLAPPAGLRSLPTSLDVLEPGDYAAPVSRHLRDLVRLMAALGYEAPSAHVVVQASLDGTTVGVHLRPTADSALSKIGTDFAADTVRWARRHLVRTTG